MLLFNFNVATPTSAKWQVCFFGNLYWQILEKQHKKFPICKLQFKNNKYQDKDKEESKKNKIKISYVSVRYLFKSIVANVKVFIFNFIKNKNKNKF